MANTPTTAAAFGTITIVDVGDIGQLSVRITSSQPTTVIYDPNNNVYTPDWAQYPLKLTPEVYYAGRLLKQNEYKVDSWEWNGQEILSEQQGTKRVSIPNVKNLVVQTFETTSHSLEINESLNKTQIVAKVTISYTEPTTQTSLKATADLTFTQIRLSEIPKTISVSGDNLFVKGKDNKYLPEKITLHADVSETVKSLEWAYKNAKKEWVNIPSFAGLKEPSILNSQIEGKTIFPDGKHATIAAYEGSIVNGAFSKETLKKEYNLLVVSDGTDGAPGDKVYYVDLTNEEQTIPNSDGIIKYDLAETTVNIYKGGIDDSAYWRVQPEVIGANGATYDWNWRTKNFKLTDIGTDNNTASVKFTCTRYLKKVYNDQEQPEKEEADLLPENSLDQSVAPIIKTFTITVVKTGKDGISPTVYQIVPSQNQIKLEGSTLTENTEGTGTGVINYSYNLSAIDFTIVGLEGNTFLDSKTIGEKGLKYSLKNGKKFLMEGVAVESNKISYTLNSEIEYSSITIILYNSNNIELDSETLMVLKDGENGKDGLQGPPGKGGDPGTDAFEWNIPSTETTLVVDKNTGKPISKNQKIDSSIFQAFLGTTAQAIGIEDIDTNNRGITVVLSPTAGASANKATITFTISETFAFTKIETRVVRHFKLTSNGKTYNINYTFLRANQIEDPIFLTLEADNYSLNDNINDYNLTAKITPTLKQGNTSISNDNITWQWMKNGKVIGNYTSNFLSLECKDIDSYADIKCIATYKGEEYSSNVEILDRTDPLQVFCDSTFGDKIINSQGGGVLFPRVEQKGIIIDQITATDGDNSWTTIAPPVGETNPAQGSEQAKAWPKVKGLQKWYITKEAIVTTETIPKSTSTEYMEVQRATLYSCDGKKWAQLDLKCEYTWQYLNPENIQRAINSQGIYVDSTSITRKNKFYVEVSKKPIPQS